MSSMSLISRNGSFHGGRRSFDFPAPSLPTEIWHYIASLMPFSSFKESKLYAVNKDLLGYYLKRQYKHLRLGFSCDSCIYAERKSRLWSEKVAAIRIFPSLASFTQRLSLSFREKREPIKSDNPIPSRFQSLVSPLRRTLPCMSVKREHSDPVFDAVIYLPPLEDMADAMSHFKHLTSLACFLSHNGDYSAMIPFETILPSIVSMAWTASRSSLTRLYLGFCLPFIPDLHLDEITFPNLREFHFASWGYIGPNPPHLVNLTRARDTLLCFFSRHRHQILTLLLVMPQSQALDDMFNDMPYFPCLVNLTLTLCVTYNTPLITSLSTFLTRQSTTIEHFYPEFYLHMDILPQPNSVRFKSERCPRHSTPLKVYIHVYCTQFLNAHYRSIN